jgi:hypothetical protein
MYNSIELQDDQTLEHYHFTPNTVVRCNIIAAKGKQKVVHGPTTTSSFLDPSDEAEAGSFPEEPFYSVDETDNRIHYLQKHASDRNNPNVDLHIVDPLTYYSFLDRLERNLVSASEYFRCRGKYELEDNTYREMTPKSRAQLPIVPDSVWRTRPELLPKSSPDVSGKQESDIRTLSSLWKSYLIICEVLTSFDILREYSFSTTFYSILVKHPSTDIAELIRLPRERIDGLKTGIESAITRIADADISLEPTDLELSECIALPCDYLLGIMHLRLSNTIPNTRVSILTMCRITALLLDLALISYVGSHGSRFNVYIKSAAESIEVPNKHQDLNSFRCTLMPLACLDGFLDHAKVWAFETYNDRTRDQSRKKVTERLSILTGIEEFADVWGPVWTVPAGKELPNLVLQYNVSRGCIRRVKGPVAARFGNSVACHWDEQPSSHESKDTLLSKSDRLLIGVSLRVNTECTYTLGDFERDYHTSMRILDTAPPSWHLESRNAVIGFQQYAGASISGTQKRIPGRTVKESIWNRFAQDTEGADIAWLHSFWGVEISHCTGNSRRIKMKDLFLLPPVHKRLQRYKRGWGELTPWGRLLLPALRSDNLQDLRDVWEGNPHMQPEMAKLFCQILKLLHDTGNRGQSLVSAYFSDGEDRCLEFKVSNSDWAKSLRDSDLKAAYVVMSGTCLKCHGGHHATPICTYDEPDSTVFQTNIEFKSTTIQDYVQLYPGKKRYENVELRRNRNQITLVPDNNIFNRLPQMSTATEILVPSEYADPIKQYSALIKSSSLSYGGMDENQREPHRQVQQIQQVQQPRQQTQRQTRRRQQLPRLPIPPPPPPPPQSSRLPTSSPPPPPPPRSPSPPRPRKADHHNPRPRPHPRLRPQYRKDICYCVIL